MRNKRTLLLSGAGNAMPLWAGLAEKYDLTFFAPNAARQAVDMGLSASSMAEYADGDLQEEAANEAARLSANVVNALPRLQKQFTAAYGMDGAPELTADLGTWLPGFAHHYLRETVAMLKALERLYAAKDVAACIVHEDVTFSTRGLVGFAKTRDVPTIHLPHAACHLLPGVQDIHREARADVVLASGDYMADFYSEAGVPRENIKTIGVPAWDRCYDETQPTRKEARGVLHIAEEQVVICYASTWPQTTSLRSGFEHEMDEGLSAVLKLAREWQAVVIVKGHPNEDPRTVDFYSKALETANLPGLVMREHTPYALAASDVLIAQAPSNLCIEAAIVGLPSCYIQTADFDYATALPYRSAADGLPDVAAQARASAGDPAWGEFVAMYNAAHPHGGATERAVSEIVGIAG